MDGREKTPPEDGIDYGTGEGSAYGGGDPDVPVFFPHAHEGEPRADDHKRCNPANASNPINIFERTWLTVRAFVPRGFPSAAGWSAFASIAVAITTVFYTIYAHRQWVAMSGQIEVMREANGFTARALDESESQLEMMQRQFETSQRAQIEIDDDSSSVLLKWPANGQYSTDFKLVFRNVGNIPAKKVQLVSWILIRGGTKDLTAEALAIQKAQCADPSMTKGLVAKRIYPTKTAKYETGSSGQRSHSRPRKGRQRGRLPTHDSWVRAV